MFKFKTIVIASIATAVVLATTVISNAGPVYNPGGVGFKATQTTQQGPVGRPHDPSSGSVGFKVCKKKRKNCSG